jgi:S1-C subfamily serine protease
VPGAAADSRKRSPAFPADGIFDASNSHMHAAHRCSSLLAGLCLAAGLAIPNVRAADEDAGAAPAEPKSGTVENSVVKVFATIRGPDLAKPWTKQAPRDVTGSGMVIEGRRILTSAHVVLYASQVQVQANQAGDKLPATVEAVAPGIDLAVLKLDDETFFDTHPALPRAAALPLIKDAVLVYGFPTGGTSLSITKGIVSRIDFTGYNYPVSGLRIQIDAAINPGNSGGPALVGDRVIGLAYSYLANAQNIGYIIPSEEIDLFLKDVADGRYDGKPALYDDLQTLESPALRAFLKVDKSVHGIVVHQPYSADPAFPLKTWDVITKIGDTAVDDQGMVKLSDNLRVRFAYLVQQIASDGKVPLTVVRAGQELAVQVPVSADRPKLIPYLEGAYPSYFILGPMVFSVATEDLLGAISGSPNGLRILSSLSYLGNPMVARRSETPAFPGEQLVVVPCPFLPHKLSNGYDNPGLKVVKAVNGIPVKNLAHLVQILRDSRDEFITIEYATRTAETMVFPRAEMIAATEGILSDNGIRSQGSPDLMAIWNAKPAGGS